MRNDLCQNIDNFTKFHYDMDSFKTKMTHFATFQP